MAKNLMTAHDQWARRPADERFATMDALHRATLGHKNRAVSSVCDISDLLTLAEDDALMVTHRTDGGRASMTNWSFRQLARCAGAPAAYLERLPAALAAENLNHGLRIAAGNAANLEAANPDLEGGREAKLLFTQGSGADNALQLRALTGPGYCRIWNADITSRLCELHDAHGWRVPPARPVGSNTSGARRATADDVLRLKGSGGLVINEGDMVAPAGLYTSAHDMFAFLVNEDNRLSDGSDGGLGRGMFVYNSETGAGSFRVTRFLYRFVCGNHIVWGAEEISEIAVRHVGLADNKAFGELVVQLKEYANASAQDDEARIKRVQTVRLGADAEAVVRAVLGMRVPGLGARQVADAVAECTAQQGADGDPLTVWGVANGLTRMSQRLPQGWADARMALDRAAGQLLTKVGK